MRSHNGGKIYGAGTLCSVKAPHGLNGFRIQIHRFRAVAPAGCDGKGCNNPLSAERFRATRGFFSTADGAGSDDTANRCAVGIADVLLDEFFCCICHIHGLRFQTFSHAAPAAVDYGPNTNFCVSFHGSFFLSYYSSALAEKSSAFIIGIFYAVVNGIVCKKEDARSGI